LSATAWFGFSLFAFRLHPGYDFVLQAVPVGVFAFALASAVCFWFASVAPVRGNALNLSLKELVNEACPL
jgi:hypothetical protein